MTAQLIDGKKIASEIEEELKAEASRLVETKGVKPGLAVILVGADAPSMAYVKMKGRACARLGYHSQQIDLPGDSTQEQVAETIERINADPAFHGILLQSPVPSHLDEDALMMTISPDKDVDGLHPVNVGRLALGHPCFEPCTPKGVVELMRRSGIETKGKKAVVIGRSNLVGRPLAQLLSQKRDGGDATVTMCHSRTVDLAGEARQADLLIAATGMAEMITADMVKPGAAVFDVGVSRVDDASAKRGYRLVGDIAFDEVKEVAGHITPNPGGVGPMTIAMLMSNTLWSAKRSVGEA